MRPPFRRIGVFRRDRRPRPQEGLPGAASDGQTRPPRRARHRRGQGRLGPRPTQAQARDGLEQHGGVDEAAFAKLCGLLRYVDGDYKDPATFQALRKELGRRPNARRTTWPSRPALFGLVVEQLGKSGCAGGARVIVEKPFGRDLASAKALNKILLGNFDESAIFRIDHLPRETAGANLHYFRFANAFLEPSGTASTSRACRSPWRRTSESRAAVPSTTRTARSATWSRTTCSRSWPTSRWSRRPATDGESIRDEKVKVLKAVPPLEPREHRPRPVPRLPRREGGRARLPGRDLRRRAAGDRLTALAGCRSSSGPGSDCP